MESMELMLGNSNLFKGKRILLTGDTGFKGSWLAIWLTELGANVFGYSLPPKSDEDNFVRCGLNKLIHHVDGDVRDSEALLKYFLEVQPDIAIHMAAQALVLPSYEDPIGTLETNIMGTAIFFEAVRKTSSVKVALNVTSDKCYHNNESIWGYRESDPMGGKDPYSVSKGCSELITSSYMHSFFNNSPVRVASVRAGNVIGGGDWAENRIIPDYYRSIKDNVELIIRNPSSTRPWQFVLEPLRGYLTLISKLYGEDGDESLQGGWNFGPLDRNNVSVRELIQRLNSTAQSKELVQVANASGGVSKKEAVFLKLDISKAKALLNWEPCLNLDQTINFIKEGYRTDLNSVNTAEVYSDRRNQIINYTNLFTSL